MTAVSRFTAILVSAAVVAGASAQFVVNIPTSDSSGPVGDAGNGVTNAVYGGADTIFGRLTFSGDLTEVNTATFASEADWNILNSTHGTALNFGPSAVTGFTGTIHVDAQASVLVWANTGDNFRLESFESFDDGAGVDATWTDVTFTLDSDVTCTNLGSYASGTDFTIDTEGSTFDTELALYTASGTLIAADDDGGTGLLSLIAAGVLADGDYIILAGGFNSQFVSGFALAGTSAGDLNLNINGSSVATGTIAAGQLAAYCFNVPEPSALALLALGAIAAIRRR